MTLESIPHYLHLSLVRLFQQFQDASIAELAIDASFWILHNVIIFCQTDRFLWSCYLRNYLQLWFLWFVENAILFIEVDSCGILWICFVLYVWWRAFSKIKCPFFCDSAIIFMLIVMIIGIILLYLWFLTITNSLWAAYTIRIEIAIVLIDRIYAFREAHHHVSWINFILFCEIWINIRGILLLEFLLSFKDFLCVLYLLFCGSVANVLFTIGIITNIVFSRFKHITENVNNCIIFRCVRMHGVILCYICIITFIVIWDGVVHVMRVNKGDMFLFYYIICRHWGRSHWRWEIVAAEFLVKWIF